MPQLNADKIVSLAQARGVTIQPTTFYFLRHGQTPRNALKIFQTYAEPLSDLGKQQARDAAAALASERIAAIVVSDATRTLQTSEPAAQTLSLTPTPTPMLRERHFGDLWGTSSETIDWDCRPKNGETAEQFVKRTLEGVEFALNRDEEPVLIVAHGGNLLVLAAALGLEIDRSKFGNALPLKFTRGAAGWEVAPLLAPGDPESANLA